jgi:hypothetical protein
VFDESTMVAMSQGGIDPSVGYFGVYGWIIIWYTK